MVHSLARDACGTPRIRGSLEHRRRNREEQRACAPNGRLSLPTWSGGPSARATQGALTYSDDLGASPTTRHSTGNSSGWGSTRQRTVLGGL